MGTKSTTGSLSGAPAEQRERFFFVVMAVAIGISVLAGFGIYVALGITSFNAPWWVHIHGVSFMAWIGLYLTQNLFVLRNSIDQHRRLGRIGAVLAIWMVIVGYVLTPVTLATDRVPPVPIFTPAFFLALDWVNITCFAALIFSALYFRRQTEWHRRLMLCATICVIAPAVGRLLSLAGLMTEWSNMGVLLIYVAIAMFADWRIKGQVHPAYFWGFSAIFMQAPAITGLAALPSFQGLAMRIAS
jgi:hypothetical protein